MPHESSNVLNSNASSEEQRTWWYSPLIWGSLLLLLYLLRDFFLIGFLTFLLCFVVRSLVVATKRRIDPRHENRRLDWILTLAIFFGCCLILFGLGRYFVPEVLHQGKSLAVQLRKLNAEEVRNSLLSRTIGAWEFNEEFGSPSDPRYQLGWKHFQTLERVDDEPGQPEPAKVNRQETDFESATKLSLGNQWWATNPQAAWIRVHANDEGPSILANVSRRVDDGLNYFLRIPVQVLTALLLSIFMLFEWEGVTRGIANLRNTRVQPVYDEVAPGIVALGKLIGRSFQGQVLIALINACLILVALWLIGVENKFVLALVMFVSCFIPVVGVLLSGVPICAVAILQPDGSLWMVFQVMVAIGIIHLLEAMIFSPRINGKIGDLHPVLVIVILLVAEKFFGMWGLVLGVPVAIYVIRVVILDLPIPGIYEPARFQQRDAANELTIEHVDSVDRRQ